MLEQRKGGGGVTDLRPDFFRSNFIFENIHWAVQKFRILIKFYVRMTDQEKNEYFHDFILWQQEGLDIEKQHCLFINHCLRLFDFVSGELKEKREKVIIEETYCTLG